jgi:hypothetical protein
MWLNGRKKVNMRSLYLYPFLKHIEDGDVTKLGSVKIEVIGVIKLGHVNNEVRSY